MLHHPTVDLWHGTAAGGRGLAPRDKAPRHWLAAILDGHGGLCLIGRRGTVACSCSALGSARCSALTIPQSILGRADEVIE
jgi:hypothetical protein